MQLFRGDRAQRSVAYIQNQSGESFTTGSNHPGGVHLSLGSLVRAQVNWYEVVIITQHRQFCASI